MPVPMTAPMPSAVRSNAPTARLSPPSPSPDSVSRTSTAWSLTAHGPVDDLRADPICTFPLMVFLTNLKPHGGGDAPPSGTAFIISPRGSHRIRQPKPLARGWRAALPAAVAAGRAARARAREGREGGAAARAVRRGRPARAHPARPPRGPDAARSRARGGRHDRRRGAVDQEPPGAPARDEADGGGARGGRDGHDQRDVLQPALARAPLQTRHPPAV